MKRTVEIFSILTIALITAVSAMSACGSAAKVLPAGEFNRLVYEFIDSSKSPEYQRNYIITVTESEAKITVTSDRTLADTSVKLDKNKFDEITQTIKAAELRNRPEASGGGCNGGTTDKFAFYADGKSEFSGIVYHCGGEDSGNLTGNYKSVKEKIESLFPNFKELTR